MFSEELTIKKLLLTTLLLGAIFNPTFSPADEGEELFSDEQAIGAPGTLENTVLKEPKMRHMKVSRAVKQKTKKVKKSRRNSKRE